MNILFGNFGESITFTNVLVRIAISLLIGGIIGFERERKNRPAGLRTHMLVCLAATMIAMLEQQMIYEVSVLGNSSVNLSIGRLSVGVITGIGFIGAGTIMMAKNRVIGLTTAASLWSVGCLGLVNGMGYCLVAFVACVVVIVVMEVMRVGERTNLYRIIELEYINTKEIEKHLDDYFEKQAFHIRRPTYSYYIQNEQRLCLVNYPIIFRDEEQMRKAIKELSEIEGVLAVRQQNVI